MCVIGSLSVSISLNYWIMIPLAPLVVIMLYVRKYFLSTSTEIKRLDGISKPQTKSFFLKTKTTYTCIWLKTRVPFSFTWTTRSTAWAPFAPLTCKTRSWTSTTLTLTFIHEPWARSCSSTAGSPFASIGSSPFISTFRCLAAFFSKVPE